MRQVVHLRSQHGQPYGSVRKCCSRCGAMCWGPNSPPWVEYEEDFNNLPEEYIACHLVPDAYKGQKYA